VTEHPLLHHKYDKPENASGVKAIPRATGRHGIFIMEFMSFSFYRCVLVLWIERNVRMSSEYNAGNASRNKISSIPLITIYIFPVVTCHSRPQNPAMPTRLISKLPNPYYKHVFFFFLSIINFNLYLYRYYCDFVMRMYIYIYIYIYL
jgi:hypothetical protein